MNAALATVVAFLGACVSAAVAWLLGRGKAGADADHVAIETADKLVTLLRADMVDVRSQLAAVRAECERDNNALKAQVQVLRAENTGLRHRVDDLEAELRGHPRPPDVGA